MQPPHTSYCQDAFGKYKLRLYKVLVIQIPKMQMGLHFSYYFVRRETVPLQIQVTFKKKL